MLKCKICGNTDYLVDTGCRPKYVCSHKCYEDHLKFSKPPNCECVVCGIKMYLKPFRVNRVKHGVTCSAECNKKLRSILYSGDGNHQYGIRGKDNASYKSDKLKNSHGYIVEFCENHPFPRYVKEGVCRVRQHRLVVERNMKMFDREFFIKIDGKYYLKPESVVHHKNGIKDDNRVENLEVMSRSEHSKLHAKTNILKRCNLGRITGVLKSDELRETPEVDNPEPSL